MLATRAMDSQFWLDKWKHGQIGFHEDTVHPMLVSHWPELGVSARVPVFVPLCGKSRDLAWLRARGHAVRGVELSAIAVEAFFSEHGIPYVITAENGLRRYEGDGYRLWCGDFFALERAALERVAAIYDRAALIALPPDMRAPYARRLGSLAAPGCRMLLITLDYDREHITPPPFIVDDAEIAALFGAEWTITRLDDAPAVVKGEPARETAHALVRRR